MTWMYLESLNVLPISNWFQIVAFGLQTKLFQRFYVGWKRGTLVCNNSLSLLFNNICTKFSQQLDQICMIFKMYTFNTLRTFDTLYILKSEPMINRYMERKYYRGLSISSLPMLECSFHMRYKWFLANVSMTLGNIWEENNLFVEIELLRYQSCMQLLTRQVNRKDQFKFVKTHFGHSQWASWTYVSIVEIWDKQPSPLKTKHKDQSSSSSSNWSDEVNHTSTCIEVP